MAKAQPKQPPVLSAEIRKQVRFIAGVVVVVFTIGVAILAWALKAPLLPAIDDVYDISDYFASKQRTELQKALSAADSVRAGRIDSGYSESFRFAQGRPFDPERLIFFALDRQRVTVTMTALPLTRINRDIRFEAQVDGIPWDTLLVPDRDGPIRSFSSGMITSKLRFIGGAEQNVHEVRIVPLDTTPMGPQEDVLVNVLVLVHTDEVNPEGH